jgi:ATP-binding cassette subfamily F protein 3
MDITILNKNYGTASILNACQIKLNKGGRYGLIGANGSGKSTILRIIAGLDQDFIGKNQLDPGVRISLFNQESDFNPRESVMNNICAPIYRLQEERQQIESQLAECTDDKKLSKLMNKYQKVLDELEELGGYTAEERKLDFLDRLHLLDRAYIPSACLSGGEQARLRLSLALDQRSDILLLDEPGNHLDIPGLEWLEDKIKDYRGIIVLVSHDRYLLERFTSVIWWIDQGKIKEHPGSFSSWRLSRIQNAAAQGLEWQADKKKIQRLEELVRRFRQFAQQTADPAWGKRLRARETQLEFAQKESATRPNTGQASPEIVFDANTSQSRIALEITDYIISYDGKTLAHIPYLFIASGERLALIGANGCGISSLIRQIVDNPTWDSSKLRVGPSQKIGYLAQDRQGCNLSQTVMEHFLLLEPCRPEDVISFLKPFGLKRAQLDQKLAELSGGQWNLFQLARAIRIKANFLILDEPSNHLDIDAREALEDALSDFQGTLLVVSHDRWFLQAVCKRVAIFTDQIVIDTGLSPEEYFASSQEQRKLMQESRCLEKAAIDAIRNNDYQKAKALGQRLKSLMYQ